jgi:predicted DNA-binding protein (UPF0251 family)
LPCNDRFGPLNATDDDGNSVTMSIDEYETIRLIDLEGFTQEKCATQMKIARTTVQGMYYDARKKLSESLVNGKVLRIEGGDYKICDGQGCDGKGFECSFGGCYRHRHGNDTENPE